MMSGTGGSGVNGNGFGNGIGNGIDVGRLQNNNNQVAPIGVMTNMQIAIGGDAATMYQPAMQQTATPSPAITFNQTGGGEGSAIAVAGVGSAGEQMKRKRGRPRKYPSGGTHGLTSPPPQLQLPALPQQPQPAVRSTEISSPTPMAAGVASLTPAGKKKMGRPPGSTGKHKTTGSGQPRITPYVVTVQTGEDVSSAIMSFFQDGKEHSICILSANGSISNVTLAQAASSTGGVTYEGRFEILSLSASFMITGHGGQRTKSGSMSVSLAGPDGRVLGGNVAGLLIAASPLQLVVASYIVGGEKYSKLGSHSEALNSPESSSLHHHQTTEAPPHHHHHHHHGEQ